MTTVIIAAPLLIAAVVMAVRFVAADSSGSGTTYSVLVLDTANLVSFWRLNEQSGSTAADSKTETPGLIRAA